jgi:hypothetical protein
MTGPVWRIPAALALLSAAGLLVALVDDGVWDVLGAVALLVPLALAWVASRRGSG